MFHFVSRGERTIGKSEKVVRFGARRWAGGNSVGAAMGSQGEPGSKGSM